MTIGIDVSVRRLVVGCGYLGMRVAEHWQAELGSVFAMTRCQRRTAEFARKGWSPLLGDVCGPLPVWPEVDTVLLAVGFDPSAGYSIRDVYVDGIQRVIDGLPDSVSTLIYISSTGVYGPSDDDWLDELSPCHPKRDGGQACWEAEQRLFSSRFADRLLVLRLAGIYGPQRLPRLSSLASGDPIEAEPEDYVNLIHVDDAARVVAALEQHPLPAMFCVSDGAPCQRREFLSLAASELGLPAPRFRPADPDREDDQRGGKRICNRRLIAALPDAIQFPSFRQGLPDAVRRTKLAEES
jgi:nucleoside-diphosphate-sugar epimerase